MSARCSSSWSRSRSKLKLTNATARPQIVDEHVLDVDQGLVVIITKKGEPTRQLLPIARHCRAASQKVLQPEESIYAPMLASMGPNGWNISDPGTYGIQVCLHLPSGEDILSNELRIVVEPARTTEDETIAQDYFTEDVGRVIALEGSRVLDAATDTLAEIADKFRHRRVAVHANLVLGVPLATEYKVLSRDSKHDDQPFRIEALPARPAEAKDRLVSALSGDPTRSAESFGHVTLQGIRRPAHRVPRVRRRRRGRLQAAGHHARDPVRARSARPQGARLGPQGDQDEARQPRLGGRRQVALTRAAAGPSAIRAASRPSPPLRA